ncbi:barstar family protein [Streptacidiphilus sp. PAMC 29251]
MPPSSARGVVSADVTASDAARQTRPDDDLYYRMVANTFVTLFWRRELFDESTALFREHRYAVVVLDASGWAGDADLHRDIAAALDFPDYYGANLDALNDCLRDVGSRDYGVPEDAAGFVLGFTGYQAFARASPRSAQIVLDLLADHARRAAIFGQRMLCLVQSEDPDIRFEPVGGTPVMWNRAEWLDARRRPESR